ncbi:MAG TPA: bifunctional serine/threonine-protein kinase/formylglycine-generating enzyme family protein, partial [Xanthomonadaceae bacterium]|nr:bifunctional serine/threonine-protein kinase/formylglycine-generating enzyme family protein [Xanthomonadaceae bacterium]
IDGYRLLRVLGHGGMSTVYLGEQTALGRQVAIKVMLPEALADETSRLRFENEARTIARLEHPNIVGIHAVDRTRDGLPYYAMPYLPRGHLGQRLGDANSIDANQQQAIAVLRALLSALQYAHANGVVHRDVKAENVLFDEAGRALLADFGIARRVDVGPRVTTAGMAVGSTAYMAPEQARGEDVDRRADLYSLGVLAYEMLTGSLPFVAGDALSTAMMHAQDPVPRLPPPLRHWQRFIDRAMAKSLPQRFADAQQMLAALEQIARQEARPRSLAAARMRSSTAALRRSAGSAGALAVTRLHGSKAALSQLPNAAWIAAALVIAVAVGVFLREAPATRGAGVSEGRGPTAAATTVDAATTGGRGVGQTTSPGPPPAPATQPVSPAEPQLQVALAHIARRNLTAPRNANAHDSLLAAARADPAHPRLPELVNSLTDAYAQEAEKRLRAGEDRKARDYVEHAQVLARQTGRPDGPALTRLRSRLVKVLGERVDQAAKRYDRSAAMRAAELAASFGDKRLLTRARAVAQPGDAVRDDPADAVVVRAGGSLLAAARKEVTRAQYARFVAATGRPASLCRERASVLRIVAPRSWRAPGFPQGEQEPVVCVSAADAEAYAQWLGRRTGKRYRLPGANEAGALPRGGGRAVAEWLRDCRAGCRARAVAGASWRGGASQRDADRGHDDVGFRVVRGL